MAYNNKDLIKDITNILPEIDKEIIDIIIDNDSENISKIFKDNVPGIINIPASKKIKKGDFYSLNEEIKIATTNIDFGQEESLCKKNFADIMTDFISSEKIFSDVNMEYVARFQYLVNETFNREIKKYIDMLERKYGIRYHKEKDIFFTYKGGTTMKIVFEKYKSIFESLTNFNEISSKFKRSDSDYSIIINPNIVNNRKENIFLEVYKDINKLCAACLIFIKFKILSHPDFFMPLSLIKDSDIKELLVKMNQRLTEIKINKDNDFDFCEKIKNINSFIGMTYFDKQYLNDGEVIPVLTDESIDKVISDLEITDPKFIEFRDKRNVSTKRKNFYLTWDISDMEKRFLGMIPDSCDIFNNNDIYLSINETNEYPSGDPDNKVGDTKFCLQRLKLNFIAYYKILELNGSYKYGFINCPSELIDVSIMKKDSIDLKKMFEHINLEFRNYTYSNFDLRINYRSYTNYGHISDLCNILFSQFKYPWLAKKYEKRVVRLLFFFFLDLFTIYKYFHFNLIFKSIKDTIDYSIKLINSHLKIGYNLDIAKLQLDDKYKHSLKLIESINRTFAKNTGSYIFIFNLHLLLNKIDISNINEYKQFLIIIKNFFTVIKSQSSSIQKILNETEQKKLLALERKETASTISSITSYKGSTKRSTKSSTIFSIGGAYYDKYIKYKLKYLNLKKKMNK